ncbi:siderophore-interacting protein [Rhodococcoides yunnanense]|uniref:Siderophore-interacting protein n=1 Tax=Rhodococcoides yunnanense TaxID=278209 RepID=A0ABU4BH79_9NOCA|nr:siderophore-interacting protein [Rhodococcus yunnanensis]MDV6263578.1 siderophore-interacting protein [Rhodococcus yunnanensis]
MSKYLKPDTPAFYRLNVLETDRLSPSFIRVTFGGDSLSNFRFMGYDHWFRLFLPQPGQDEPRIPSATSMLWYAQYLAFSKDTRPVVRNYTISRYRAPGQGKHGDGPELDVDFVVHGSGGTGGGSGPASAWAQKAAPGDRVAIFDEGRIYTVDGRSSWQLLVGDESAAPAVLGILRSLPEDVRVKAFIEVPTEADIAKQDMRAGVEIEWIVRPHHLAKSGEAALAAVQKAELPDGDPVVYVAGEQGLATGLRRYLVNERSVPKSQICFTGYWKFGKAAP